MKIKTLIVLALLLVACAAYVLIKRSGWGREADSGNQAKAVLTETPKGVRDITLVGPHGSFAFTRQNAQWKITRPIHAKADDAAMASLVSSLESLRYERVFNKNQKVPSSEISGLDNPISKLTVVDETSRNYVIMVGNEEPLSGGALVYARVEGDDKTYVINSDFSLRLSKPLSEFRDRNVLAMPVNDIQSVQVAGRENYQLSKGPSGWSVVDPISAEADSAKVKSFLNKIVAVSATKFVLDDPRSYEQFGLEKPKLLLTVHLVPPQAATTPATASAPATAPTSAPAGRTCVLALGSISRDKMIFARLMGEPAVFQLDASLLEDLQPRLADLRNKTLLRFTPVQVEKLTYVSPAGRAEIVRNNAAWQMNAPVSGPASAAVATNYLEKLAALKAEDFDDSQPAAVTGLEKPRATVSVVLAGDNRVETLLIGSTSPSGEMTFVKPAGSTFVAVVRSADAEELLIEPANLYDPLLLEIPRTVELKKLSLQRPDGLMTLQRERERWNLMEPLQAATNADAVKKAVDELMLLRADRIVAIGKDVPEKYRKAKDQIAITFTAEPLLSAPGTQPATAPTASATYSLHVVRLDGKSFAWIDGRDTAIVGQFSAAFYDIFASEMRSVSLFEFHPSAIQNLSVTAPDHAIKIHRERHEPWQEATDAFVKIDERKVKDYLQGLVDLRIQKFVSFSNKEAEKYGLDKPALTVEISSHDIPIRTLTIGKTVENSSDRYARTNRMEGIFVLSAADVEKLDKSLKDFKVEDAAPKAASGVEP